MEALLAQLAGSVANATDLESMTRPLLELLETVTGMESTYLTSIDEAAGLQHIQFSRNTRQMKIPEGLSVPWGDTLCKRALDEGRPYTDDVAGCWGDSEAARALGIKTYLSEPVRHGNGELYGTLCAASASKVPQAPDTLKVLGLFARLIAQQVDVQAAMVTLQQDNAELSTHALTDPLTGIANRRALMHELQRFLSRAQRDQSGVQVAFIDLNGFKAINDTHGHETGDRFLIQIANSLVSGLRSGDLVARYGGDEFVVVTARGDRTELLRRCHELTRGRFENGDVTFDYAAASVGVVEAERGETDPEALVNRADAAMYEVKNAAKEAATH